jgi:thiamine-phosphate pyrophosphorylase
MAASQPHCRLYLKLPARPPAESSFLLAIAQPVAYAGCVLLGGGDSADLDAPWAEHLAQFAHDRNVAFLVEGDVELALKIGAEGVHIQADRALYARARERLGPDAIVGAGCGQNRHDAMVMAELGADYIAFGPAPHNLDAKDDLAELIAWWSEIFVVPCVAFGASSAEEASRIAALGADFVAPADSLWQAPDGAKVLAEIAAVLAKPRSAA